MKVVRFKKKVTVDMLTYSAGVLLSVIFFTIMFSDVNLIVNKYFLYLVFSLLSLFFIMRAIKKAGQELEQIIIDNDSMRFFYFSRLKEEKNTSLNELLYKVIGDNIEIKDKLTGTIVGICRKDYCESVDVWDILMETLQITTKQNSPSKDSLKFNP